MGLLLEVEVVVDGVVVVDDDDDDVDETKMERWGKLKTSLPENIQNFL